MDTRRRGPAASSNNALIRAVAVGMVCGLIISGAMFYHKLQLQTLQVDMAKSLMSQVRLMLQLPVV